MTKQEAHTKIHFYLAIAIAFSLPIARFTPICIALMFFNWLIEGLFKEKFVSFFKNRFALLFVSFFLLHLIGLVYSQNMDFALKDIEVKLSLFIFPLMLATCLFKNDKINKISNAFVLGCIVAGGAMLIRAFYMYWALGENNFFYQNFAFLLHPSYMSMYLNLAIAYVLLRLVKTPTVLNRYVSFIMIIFFTILNILLSSKMGIISNALILIGFMSYYMIRNKKYVLGSISFIAAIVFCISLIKFVPSIGGRIDSLMHSFNESTVNKTSDESTAVRKLIWRAASEVISTHFIIGVGTGDSKDALMKEYVEEGLKGAYEHKLNAHNEYLQVFVALGAIGFLLLISSLISPLLHSIKLPNPLYLVFLLLIIVNFTTESMFETQAGVMFYAFFNSLFCFNTNRDKIVKP